MGEIIPFPVWIINASQKSSKNWVIPLDGNTGDVKMVLITLVMLALQNYNYPLGYLMSILSTKLQLMLTPLLCLCVSQKNTKTTLSESYVLVIYFSHLSVSSDQQNNTKARPCW